MAEHNLEDPLIERQSTSKGRSSGGGSGTYQITKEELRYLHSF